MFYFDHNATSPLLPEAREAWLQAAEDTLGNPSSPHRLGSRAEMALQQAREALSNFLCCDPLEIVWTSGATEANNTILHHFSCALSARAEIWISAIEHPCVAEPARHYFAKRLRIIPVSRSGIVDLAWLKSRLNRGPRPGLVAVLAANNETGILQPWQEVMLLCRKWKVPYFCDATQWVGKLPAKGLGECHFVTGSAHKFGGPKGVGFLKCPSNDWIHPFLRGGKQEEGRRAGTENVNGVLSMMAAFRARELLLAAGRQKERIIWRDDFIRQLNEVVGIEAIGMEQARLWNTVTVVMKEMPEDQRWVVKLDKLGFAVSTGSACASGQEEPSHVLKAMGYSPAEAGRVLRFSSGWETTESDWAALLEALIKVSGEPAERSVA